MLGITIGDKKNSNYSILNVDEVENNLFNVCCDSLTSNL